MKKIFLIILLSIIIGYASNSQLKAQFGNTKYVVFKEEEKVFFNFNSNDESIYVYNSDSTFRDKFDLEIPINYTLDMIKLIETKSLNEDVPFKILYSIVPVNPKFQNIFKERFNGQVYTVHILNSSGINLLKLTNVVNYKILTRNEDKKLFVIRNGKKKTEPRLYSETYNIN